MIIPPSIAAIFDLFPRKARFAKEEDSPEYKAGFREGLEEGKRYAYIQTVKNTANLSPSQHDELMNFLITRGLLLTYDVNNGGFAVRKLQYNPYQEQDPGPVIRPIKITVRLKPQQRTPVQGWRFTLRGEQKYYGTNLVCFYATSLKGAMEAINIDEIEHIKID